MTSSKLKVAVLYDVWEEGAPEPEPEPEKPVRRKTKKKSVRKKKKEKDRCPRSHGAWRRYRRGKVLQRRKDRHLP